MNKTNLDVTKFDDEDYYYEHYKADDSCSCIFK